MRSEAPVLLPILRSQHQAMLLAELLLHPDNEYGITELSRYLTIPQSTVSGEVARLADAGILTVTVVGRSRLVRANQASPLVPALTELITLTYGPRSVLADAFADIADIALVLIYGSWAARYHGERGHAPRDVDVLVVGRPDRLAVYEAAQHAEERVRLPVNPTVCSVAEWADPTQPLIKEVHARPRVTVLDHTTTEEPAV